MNDAELDDLIASLAPVTDAEVALWDLADDDLCEEIMSTSTPVIHPPSDLDTQSPSPRPRRHHRLVLAAAVAVLVAGLAAGVTLVGGSAEPSAAATVDAALRESSAALEGSGRAELRYNMDDGDGDGDDDPDYEIVEHWEFSGDDSSVWMSDQVSDGVPTPTQQLPPESRTVHVDGEMYLFDAHTGIWQHDVNGDPYADGFDTDPRSLFDELDSLEFEEVGTESVDGVETQRLRATDPGQTPPLPDLYYDREGEAEVTGLELWIDEDELVRRVDLTVDTSYGNVESISVRFFDFGAPITIEAPTEYQDIDPVG